MFLRSTRWAASLLALGMSAATVVAQPPAAPATDPPPAPSLSPTLSTSSAFPNEAGDLQWNHWYDNGGSIFGDQELGPQLRFQADWIYFTRNNSAKSIPLFNGPESISQRNIDFNYQSGYRLNLGFMNDDYELEGSYFKLEGLGGSQSGTLAHSVVFDGVSGIGAATPFAQTVAGADPADLANSTNYLESTTLFSPINAAANHNDPVTPANNETNELEFLDPGARYVLKYTSSLQDFDVNLKGRRQSGRLFRFGFGYRNIQFNESGSASLRGSFNTVDNDGDETAGQNGVNDGLSNAALIAAGLVPATAGGFLENTPPMQPDTLLFTSASRATNQLNGVQATVDATFLESEYFSLGGYAKAGVYHNSARGSVSETYQALDNGLSRYTRNFSDTKDRVAFAGNLGVNGTLFLRENMRLFGGYELMYLSGVALAPDQMGGIHTDISNATSLDLRTHGSAFFHGGRLGFEILFW